MSTDDRRESRPRENRVLSEPATPQSCARDYQAGAADRATSAKKDAHAHRGGTR